jgi:hypothetical protein
VFTDEEEEEDEDGDWEAEEGVEREEGEDGACIPTQTRAHTHGSMHAQLETACVSPLCVL